MFFRLVDHIVFFRLGDYVSGFQGLLDGFLTTTTKFL